MFAKLIAATLGAGLIVATPVALAAPVPTGPAPSHHGWYRCFDPHARITIWDGKVTKQIWCRYPSHHRHGGFKPLH